MDKYFSKINPGTSLCELRAEDQYILRARMSDQTFTDIAREFGCKPATIASRYRRIVEEVLHPQMNLLEQEDWVNTILDGFREGMKAVKHTVHGEIPDHRTRLIAWNQLDKLLGGLLSEGMREIILKGPEVLFERSEMGDEQ